MFRKRKKTYAAALGALLSASLLTACYKGDGTEVRVRKAPKLEENSYADTLDAEFTDVSVRPDAPTDTPIVLDGTQMSAKQDILLIQIYDYSDKYSHTQKVNYYDRDGNVYYYRQPVEPDGDFYTPLYENWKSGATVVNIMGDVERETVQYLAAHAEDYKNTEMKTQETGKDIYGVTWLYLVDQSGEPVLLARYDDTCAYRDDKEVVDFLNWFSFFYHGDVVFGG